VATMLIERVNFIAEETAKIKAELIASVTAKIPVATMLIERVNFIAEETAKIKAELIASVTAKIPEKRE